MIATADDVLELHKRFDKIECKLNQMLMAQNARSALHNTEIASVKETVLTEAELRNTAVATLQNSVGELAESLRLKDRKNLSVAEAAHRAGMKSTTVRKWLESGELKGTKSGTRKQSRWRVAVRDLDRFLERVNNSPEQSAQAIAMTPATAT